jgi:ABC-type lipoprotein export system ATPase subunit
LEGINLDIPKGDFVFLIGKSGSGKTSLISSLI